MSNLALGADGQLHFAENMQDSYVGDLRCPNQDCGVQMKLKNLGADEKAHRRIRPYFSASKNAPHIDGCPFANTCVSFERLQAAHFQVDRFFQELQVRPRMAVSGQDSAVRDMHGEMHGSITTINKLYHYCLQHRDQDELPDGTKILEIFQDDRNASTPNEQRHTARLVKLRFRNCNFFIFDEKKFCYKMWCFFPHTATQRPPGVFYTLGFKEENMPLMKYFCEILTPLKQKYEDVFLLVGGEWKNNHCYVQSKRQISILPPNSK